MMEDNNIVAIIGTAGRGTDSSRIDRRLYDAMYECVLDAIVSWGARGAVSGGAAVADHLAVRAYLDGKVEDLVLFLPADFRGGAYVPNPSVRFNPGQTSNRYHREFSRLCGIDSLREITEAIRRGARIEIVPGFNRRNLEVARLCTHMVALTFGGGVSADYREQAWRDFLPVDAGFSSAVAANLKDGGTAHTWGQAWKPEIKRHVHLGELPRTFGCPRQPRREGSVCL